ncbi:MAG: hypoxanthine phosphoribosyltransferase [Kiritimatiellae bacterium]|nr:hypoxanthine phosphoribosyltransferase [Kiritimatiellia bacterium]
MRPHHIREVLFTADQIRQRVRELVDEIAAGGRSEKLVLVAVLRGSFMFFADLVREINRHDLHPRIDLTTLESYGAGIESSGQVRVAKEIAVDVSGADVLLVDDILDTGRTMAFACSHLFERGAASVRTCVMLDKPSRRVVPVQADYVGFTVPDVFVVGYGLDYDSYYRELPYIAKVTFTD